jgi:hypothetical protein
MSEIHSHTIWHGTRASLTSIRADLFKRKIAGKRHIPPKLKSLPPTMAAFQLHCQRTHFQTALWKAASMSTPPDLDPLQYGWEIKDKNFDQSLPHPDSWLHQMRYSTSSVVAVKLDAKQHSALVLNSMLCKCMGQANCQNSMEAVASDSDDSDGEEFDEEFDEESG